MIAEILKKPDAHFRWLKTGSIWTCSIIIAIVLNIALFSLMPRLMQSGHKQPKEYEKIQTVNFIRMKPQAVDLERRNLRYVFFVFEGLHRPWQRPLNWRLSFLQTWFQASGQPHIWARQALEEAVPQADYRWPEYVVSPRDHHPNRRANEIFTARLLAWLWEGRTD